MTGFSETDPDSEISATTDCLTYSNVESKDTVAYVYKSYPVNWEFQFEFDTIFTSTTSTTAGPVVLWGLTDTLGSIHTTWSNGVYLAFNRGGSTIQLQLWNAGPGGASDNSVNLSMNTRYYLTVERTGTTVFAKIYNNPAKGAGSLVDTLTRTDLNDYDYLYAFSVQDVNTTNRKVSGDVCHLTIEGPDAPVLNIPTVSDSTVHLSWNTVPNAESYKVKYGTTSGTYTTTISNLAATSYNVTGLQNGTTYYFAVSAVNEGGESNNSNEKSAVPAAAFSDNVTNITYTATGQTAQITYESGMVTTYTYHSQNLRLTRILTVNAGQVVLQDLNYIYDGVGNILSITDNKTVGVQNDQDFEYDEENRLVEAQSSIYGIKTFTYDEIGNLLSKDGKTYLYGEGWACPEPCRRAGPHAVTSLSDGKVYTYDANGNMITKMAGATTTEYIYDVENRLIQVKINGAAKADFVYDGDGGRTKKVTYGGSTVTNLYVGSLFEITASGGNTYESSHIFMGDSRIATARDGVISYSFADHLGGTNIITDDEGTIKENVEYKPYGEFAAHNFYGGAQEEVDFYFTGQRYDDEIGLYYYNARYYDPELGRFIQADTVVPGFDNPQALNRYSYALNNPINRVDPSGHWSFAKFFKSFVSAFVGAAVTVVTLGAAAPLAVALMAGGAVGGFIGGGLSSDQGWSWKGALIGAGVGGLTGFAMGGGLGVAGVVAGWTAVIGGAGYTIATEGTDGVSSVLGGISGGIAGGAAGVAISKATNPNSVYHKQAQQTEVQNQKNDSSLKVENKPQPKQATRSSEVESAVVYNENGEFQGIIIKDNYYSANASEGVYIRQADGKITRVPRDWKGSLSRKGDGVVYSKSGALTDPNSIRVMSPKYGQHEYPNGYVVYTEGNQPLNVYGKPDLPENTHHHLYQTGLE